MCNTSSAVLENTVQGSNCIYCKEEEEEEEDDHDDDEERAFALFKGISWIQDTIFKSIKSILENSVASVAVG